MMEPIPFRTDDAILAFALYVAGVPFFRPPTNTFTELQLKRLGFGGMSILDGAKAAWKRKERGSVEYWFERSQELPHFLKCYGEQVALIDSKEVEDGGEYLREVMRQAAGRPAECEPTEVPKQTIGANFPMDEREALFRIAVVVLKGRIPFVNEWKKFVPFLRLPEAGEAKELGNSTTQFPGFKLIPVNASEETLRKFKLI